MPGFRIYLISLLLCQHFYLVANAREKAIPLQQVEADFFVTTSSDWMPPPPSRTGASPMPTPSPTCRNA